MPEPVDSLVSQSEVEKMNTMAYFFYDLQYPSECNTLRAPFNKKDFGKYKKKWKLAPWLWRAEIHFSCRRFSRCWSRFSGSFCCASIRIEDCTDICIVCLTFCVKTFQMMTLFSPELTWTWIKSNVVVQVFLKTRFKFAFVYELVIRRLFRVAVRI